MINLKMIKLFRPNLLYRFYCTPNLHSDYNKKKHIGINIKHIEINKIIDLIKKKENWVKNKENKIIYNSYKNMYSGIPITNLFNKND